MYLMSFLLMLFWVFFLGYFFFEGDNILTNALKHINYNCIDYLDVKCFNFLGVAVEVKNCLQLNFKKDISFFLFLKLLIPHVVFL